MELELDIILFTAEDIVTLSDNQKDDVLGDIFG
jgi:hypothetical protein